MSATFDFSEVERLSASIASASSRLPAEVRAVVAKGALNIKTETRQNIPDRYWGGLKPTVNYEMQGNAFYSAATIGYDDPGVKKDPLSQGGLAGIYEFGSARRAPHPTLMPAFAAESPRFQKAIEAVVSKVIEDAL